MSRGFVVLIFVVIFGVSGIALLDQMGVLPDQMHRSIVRIESTFIPVTSVPNYLQKFEGVWQVSISPSTSPGGVDCPQASGTVEVRAGALSGALGAIGQQVSLRGVITESGYFAGTFKMGQRTGTLEGSVAGSAGSGSWRDDYDCVGSFTLSKQDIAFDPASGVVALIRGYATIRRGGETRSLAPKEELYTDDVVTVTSGVVSLTVGTPPSKPVNLSAGESYTVE